MNGDSQISVRWLGRVTYADGLALQEELVTQKIAGPTQPDHLLLLEHEPVYTIGRTPDQSSLREPAALPFPVHVTNRGGQATYHGPGQLVGYPIIDLRRRGQDLHKYLRALEEILIELSVSYGVAAHRQDGLTGVWVQDRKLASLGVGVRRWVSMHGFALNIAGPLEGFAHITPCGIGGVQMTSLEREGALGVTVESAAEKVGALFPDRFGRLIAGE